MNKGNKKLLITSGFIICFIIAILFGFQQGYFKDFQDAFFTVNTAKNEPETRADGAIVDTNTESLDSTIQYGGLPVTDMEDTFQIDYVKKNNPEVNYHFSGKINNFTATRNLEYDINKLNLSISDKIKQHMDENMNFVDAYQYVTISISLTNTCETENDINKYFPLADGLYTITDSGITASTGESYCVDSANIGYDGKLKLKKGEQTELTFYYIIADNYMEQQLAFKLCQQKDSPYKDPYILLQAQ